MEKIRESIDVAANFQRNDLQDYQVRPVKTKIRRETPTPSHRPLGTVIKSRFGLIVAIAMGVTTAVGVWTRQQPSIYQGSFQLLAKSGPSSLNTTPSPGHNDPLNPINNDTQLQILKSSQVIKPVLDRLSSSHPHLNYDTLINPDNPLNSPLKIVRLPNSDLIEVSYKGTNPQLIFSLLTNLSEAYVRYGSEMEQAELKKGIEFVKTQLPKLEEQVNLSQDNLQKFRQKNSFMTPEQQGEQITKQLSQLQAQYFETQVKIKETTSLYERLKVQIKLTPEQALTASYLSESPRYQNLLNQLQKIEIEITEQSAIFQEESPNIQVLKEQKANLLPLLEQESALVLGENINPNNNFPAVNLASLSPARLALNQQFIQSANDLEVLKVRREILAEQIGILKAQMEQMPLMARQYSDLQRQVQISTERLTRFLDAQEKLQIQAAQKLAPWQLLSAPRLPKEALSPNLTQNLSLAAMGGLILGLMAALMVDRLDQKIHSKKELETLTQLPILGNIPFQKALKRIKPSVELALLSPSRKSLPSSHLQQKPNQIITNFSAFLEAFLALQININLWDTKEPLKSIVISSSITGEGKSTIALHLAQAAAVMGQKVLLVEADLRRPQYHHWLEVDHEEGLGHVLADNLDIASVIQPVPRWENLSVIMSGDIAGDPARLLASGKMKQIINQLHHDPNYDLVIYDTPPLLGFADAKVLAASAQGMILVTRMDKSNRQALTQAIDDLEMSEISVLGLIANGMNRSKVVLC